jgi:hypothetical protein
VADYIQDTAGNVLDLNDDDYDDDVRGVAHDVAGDHRTILIVESIRDSVVCTRAARLVALHAGIHCNDLEVDYYVHIHHIHRRAEDCCSIHREGENYIHYSIVVLRDSIHHFEGTVLDYDSDVQ